MVIKDRREQIDVRKYRDSYRDRIQVIRNKIVDDKNYQTILLYTLDQLLDGIDKDRVNGRLVFYLISVRRKFKKTVIIIRFKHSERIKCVKNIDFDDFDKLRNLFLNIAQEIGLEVRNCKNNPKEGFDIYFAK